MVDLDRVLFGDNQFFGVNHMSEEKAKAQSIRFQSIDSVMTVLDNAYDAGIRTFMCTTHDRIEEVCDRVRNNASRYADLKFYPCMPYAHKYANAVTEDGLLGAAARFLPSDNVFESLSKSGLALATRDANAIAELLIDAEMKMFTGLKTPVIFLQNVVTDLLLGLGAVEPLAIFSRHVQKVYGAEAGFITMNLPLLLDTLDELEIDNPIVCANINKAGFRMCGGSALYEKLIETRRFRPIAMSIFASGAIPVEQAVDYVCRQAGIASIVFGASSSANIQETKSLIDSY